MNKYEQIFSELLIKKNFSFQEIPREKEPTPDFLVTKDNYKFIAEITHMTSEPIEFGKCYSRTVGKKLKAKVTSKQKQIKNAREKYECPIALVIYDITCLSETSHHDLMSLFGDWTLTIGKTSGKIIDSFHGRNSKLRDNYNTGLSAIISARWTSVTDIFYIAYLNPYAEFAFEKNFFKSNFNIEEINI